MIHIIWRARRVMSNLLNDSGQKKKKEQYKNLMNLCICINVCMYECMYDIYMYNTQS